MLRPSRVSKLATKENSTSFRWWQRAGNFSLRLRLVPLDCPVNVGMGERDRRPEGQSVSLVPARSLHRRLEISRQRSLRWRWCGETEGFLQFTHVRSVWTAVVEVMTVAKSPPDLLVIGSNGGTLWPEKKQQLVQRNTIILIDYFPSFNNFLEISLKIQKSQGLGCVAELLWFYFLVFYHLTIINYQIRHSFTVVDSSGLVL